MTKKIHFFLATATDALAEDNGHSGDDEQCELERHKKGHEVEHLPAEEGNLSEENK